MAVGLVPMLLALASAQPESEILVCDAGFYEGGRIGNVQLVVDREYDPLSLTVSLSEADGWTRAEIGLDPSERRLPGSLAFVFFAVRFTRAPSFPVTMTAYADGALRWRHDIHTPFWPTTLAGSASAAPAGREPGTVDHLGRADDGLPVPAPRELRMVLIDARGRQVGETRYALPIAEPGPVATALAAVETRYRGRACFAPPPPID